MLCQGSVGNFVHRSSGTIKLSEAPGGGAGCCAISFHMILNLTKAAREGTGKAMHLELRPRLLIPKMCGGSGLVRHTPNCAQVAT